MWPDHSGMMWMAPSWAETVSLSAQAHGLLPHLGAGAGQGLEDALLLVRLLTSLARPFFPFPPPLSQHIIVVPIKNGELVSGSQSHDASWDEQPTTTPLPFPCRLSAD